MGLRRGGPPEAHQGLVVAHTEPHDQHTVLVAHGHADTRSAERTVTGELLPQLLELLGAKEEEYRSQTGLTLVRVGSSESSGEPELLAAPSSCQPDLAGQRVEPVVDTKAPKRLLQFLARSTRKVAPDINTHLHSLMCTKSSQQLFLCLKRKKSASRSSLSIFYTPFKAFCQTHPLHL